MLFAPQRRIVSGSLIYAGVVWMLFLAAGCGGKTTHTTPPSATAKNDAASLSSATSTPADPSDDSINAAQRATDPLADALPPPSSATDGPDAGDAPARTDRPPTPDAPPHPRDPRDNSTARTRFLALTSRGPLLIQLTMTVDGQPFVEPLEERVREALLMIDANGDGVQTWTELVENPRFRYGGLGNIAVNTAAEQRQLIQNYDVDKDGRVDPDELPRLLTRNAGGSHAFRLTSGNYYRYRNRSDSPVRLLLDRDQDGRLDASELDQAPTRLRALDVDEDEILQAVEASVTNEPVPPLTKFLASQPESAIALSPNHRWDLTAFTLSQLYALGGELQRDDFRIDASFFTALDQNLNGRLETSEWKNLLTIQPHLDVEMNFRLTADGRTASTLRLRRVAPNLRILEREDRWKDRLVLELPGMALTFFLHDAAVSSRVQARTALAMYDANQNGYVEVDELPEASGLAAVFAEIDGDSNDQLNLEELEGFLGQQQLAFNSQLRGRAGEADDALFVWLDQDHDGRLTSRELVASRERIEQLDSDQDGVIGVEEIPDAYLVGVVRGDPNRDDQSFLAGMQRDVSAKLSDAPQWFVHMDINRDGDVSWREFLGQPSDFQQLDRNQDGFLDIEECSGSHREP